MKKLLIILLLSSLQISSSGCLAKQINKKNNIKTNTLNKEKIETKNIIRNFNDRRWLLITNSASRGVVNAKHVSDIRNDIYGNRAIANLLIGRFEKQANERIKRTAEWFEFPHPKGRKLQGECDFAAVKLTRAYYLFNDTKKLEPETLKEIKNFFLNYDYESCFPSENHFFLFRSSRYLMAQAFPDKMFKAYGKKGKELLKIDGKWLENFIKFRARRGWGEFDSTCYLPADWECLVNLYDFSKNKKLKKLAGMMLDLLLVDMAVDSLNGMYGGAHGRIYQNQAMDHKREPTFLLQYLYFGNVDPALITNRELGIEPLTSTYRPSEIIIDITLNRKNNYENRERKHLHNTEDPMPEKPLPGSICKYTYWTPEYVMGCVQKQDPYPENCIGKWYANHEQHQWDLTVGTNTTSRIFTHHPGKKGPEHGYWTGDIDCGCGSFFQNKNALLALYKIPTNQPYQLIHAYVPKNSFEEIIETNGFIFIRENDTYIALKLLRKYEWTTKGDWKDKEVISKGGHNGAVCEVGSRSDFGSFDNFCKEISGNKIEFDENKMILTYYSKNQGKLCIDTLGLRELNDKKINLDYPTYHSPYLNSKWDSGIIEITKGKKKLLLNFIDETRAESVKTK